jgi:preprotein translocase subunit YajC
MLIKWSRERENVEKPRIGDRVPVHRGTYKGRECIVVRYTKARVVVELVDVPGKTVVIHPESLIQPPVDEQYPELVVGVCVTIVGGIYPRYVGVITKVTEKMVKLQVGKRRAEIRVRKENVKVRSTSEEEEGGKIGQQTAGESSGEGRPRVVTPLGWVADN